MLSSKTKRELKIDQRQILIDSIEIGIPSPQQILTWGERVLPNGKKVGLIKNSKTVNYKRFTPFRDGLFCERIFGPVTSFVCACGKKQPHSKVLFCEKCEVEYIDQRSRRYRLGYISLLSPVTHIWYLKGRPSYLSIFLGKRKKTVVALAYCNAYLIEHGTLPRNDTIKSSDARPDKFEEKGFPFQQNKKPQPLQSYVLLNQFSLALTRRGRGCVCEPRRTKHSFVRAVQFLHTFCRARSKQSKTIHRLQICKELCSCSLWLTKQSFAHKALQELFKKKHFKSFQGGGESKWFRFAMLTKKRRYGIKTRVPMPFVRSKSSKILCDAHRKPDKKARLKNGRIKSLSLQASSYASYPYVRQHTLPFLPSLISHFYLRDALLSFLFSVAAREDLPLMGYCHSKRWEPLRDVHRFMAHQTVDTLKNNLSFEPTHLTNSFSKEIQDFEGVRGYKTGFKAMKQAKQIKGHGTFVKDLKERNKRLEGSGRAKEQSLLRFSAYKTNFCKVTGMPANPKFVKSLVLEGTQSFDLRSSALLNPLGIVQKSANLRKNEERTTLSEDKNRSLLSGLEVTAIREILSYTGGGALQQLLQQFDQHSLCKFLFAEAQILRVLYETQSASFCTPFLQSAFAPPFGEKGTYRLFAKQGAIKTNINQDRSDDFLACNRASSIKTAYPKASKKICKYDDFQSRTDDLQKKQMLRISRRIYKVARRLKVTQLLTRNHRKPEWMILSHLPVLPPDLRPILQMSEKVIVASDLNIMYQRVIYRNNRHLRVRFIDFHLVTAIQRLVQDAVDRLIENGKGGSKPYYTQGGRPLKSLSDILKGKKGRFRLNLLGKRVDFSGRSVIVVSPLCKIHECGLPKDIALELYHYFLLRQLIVKRYCSSIVTAKKMIKSKSSLMWDVLRELMYHHPVLLNRAPTLHRLGIQAFQPKLVLGNAILLHPLVCSGFNADFDGDQMGVHLPLSFSARAESWELLWSRNNLLSPATGQPMLVPSQDMVLGFYYITAQAVQIEEVDLCVAPKGHPLVSKQKASKSISKQGHRAKTNRFLNLNDVITDLQTGKVKVHQPVWLCWGGKIENEEPFQKPLELRIHSFGVQQSIYERCISSNFFTKIGVKAEPNAEQEPTWNTGIPPRHEILLWRGTPPKQGQLAFKGWAQTQKHLGIEHCTDTDINSFLISIQPGVQHVRTTAGRVLMNNLIKD